MSPKFNPVRLLAVVVAALVAFIGAAAAPIYGGRPLVSVVVLAWCAVVIAVLTAVGGELARNLVTPLAAPRDAGERPLVPLPAPSRWEPASEAPLVPVDFDGKRLTETGATVARWVPADQVRE